MSKDIDTPSGCIPQYNFKLKSACGDRDHDWHKIAERKWYVGDDLSSMVTIWKCFICDTMREESYDFC